MTTIAAEREVITVQLQGASGTARRVTWMGRPFRVIPAVLVRSQVLHNNIGRLLLPASDITEQWAAQWNGIPVLVGPHPTHRGVHVSGRTPELWEERGAGWIFNARADNDANQEGVRRLVAEVWLDEARAPVVAGMPAVLTKVNAGQAVELSTGFGAQVQMETGQFAGLSYEGIMHPVGADHLVISATMTGACAVDHGCGLGVNAAPLKEDTDMTADTPAGETPRWKTVLANVAEFFTGRVAANADQTGWAENTVDHIARELSLQNAMPASDQEFANILRDALQGRFGGGERRVVISDVFSALKQVVFWLHTPLGSEPPGAEFYRCAYEAGTASEGVAVTYTFTAPERVRRMTGYESVSGTEGTAAPVGNASPPCGCHSEEEGAMTDQESKALKDQMTALASQVAELTTAVTASVAAANAAVTAANTAAAAEPKGIAELTAAVTALTGRVDTMHNAQQAEVEAERTMLVQELSKDSRTPFSAAELEAQPVDALRKLAQMAKVPVSFTGRGAPRAVVQSSNEPAFAPPVPYFAKKAEAAAT